MGAAGYGSTCGSVIQTAWGTTGTITNRVPIFKESLTETIKQLENEALVGLAGQDMLDADVRSIAGAIETDLRYTQEVTPVATPYWCGSDLWLSLAMGGAPAYNSSINTLFLAESPSKYATIVFDKQGTYWEFGSCAFKGFKLAFKSADVLRVTFDVLARSLLRTGTTNGAAQIAALAARGGKRAKFGDPMVFRLNAITDGALDAGDAFGFNELTLEYDAAISEPEHCSPDYNVAVGSGTHGDNTTTHSALLTLPFVRNGKRKVEMSFSAPRYMADTLLDWRDAETELQMDVCSSIDAGARTFRLLCPRLKVTECSAPIEGAALMGVKGKMTLLYNGGTSSGSGANAVMTNSVPSTNKIPEEFQIELKNSADGRTAAIWT